MIRIDSNRWRMLLLAIGFCLLAWNAAAAAEKKDMGGWEPGGTYDRYYNPAEMDSFKGTVIGIEEVVPLPGMAPGLALLVQESGEEKVVVHLCPLWFESANGLRIKKGDRVKVSGVWAEIDDKDVFMGSKVKKGGYTFKVRLTKDGTPFWAMPADQLARERAAAE